MTPQLRFPEFTDEWQVKKLQNILTTPLSNGATIHGDNLSVTQTNQALVQIDSLFNSDLTLNISSLVYLKKFTGNRLLRNNDIIINRVSIKPSGVGKMVIVRDTPSTLRLVYESNMFRLRLDEDQTLPLFIAYFGRTSLYAKQKLALARTGNQASLSQDDIKRITLAIPGLKEQRKITEFLTVVDEKISLLEQKVENLETYKRGMMQKIFSQQIRFTRPDSSQYSEWHTKKLGDVVAIKTGKKDVNEGNPLGKYPFFTCAREHTYSDDYSFEGKAILIAGNGDVGHTSYYDGKFEAYQRTYVLQEFKLPAGYLYIYLKSMFQAFAESEKQQGSMPYIKLSTLQNFKIPVQSGEEQDKIADLLSVLDQRITLAKNKLEKTKQFKRSLLQRMFV